MVVEAMVVATTCEALMDRVGMAINITTVNIVAIPAVMMDFMLGSHAVG